MLPGTTLKETLRHFDAHDEYLHTLMFFIEMRSIGDKALGWG